MFIDTAGLRRKSKVEDQIEKYSVIRAKMAVERASVCVIMIDAVEGFTEQDAKVAGLAHEQGKAVLLSTHDLEIAFQTTDEVWILQPDGLQTGTLDALEQRGAVSAFLAKSGLRYEAESRRIVIDEFFV